MFPSAVAFTSPLPLSHRITFSTCIQPFQAVSFARTIPKRPRSVVHMAVSSPEDKILEGPITGRYGEWYLRQSDADGVQTYRVSLSVMCASYAAAVALALTSNPPAVVYDALYFSQLAAFAVALQTIHIYAKPLHQVLKGLWLVSFVVSLFLETTFTGGLVEGVYSQPMLLLAIGWQFVALTGLFIKEAFCFGRAEAISLIALVPILTGGQFLNVLGEPIQQGGAVLFVALFAFFCVRKFGQSAVDDIGDMTVFEHLARGGSL